MGRIAPDPTNGGCGRGGRVSAKNAQPAWGWSRGVRATFPLSLAAPQLGPSKWAATVAPKPIPADCHDKDCDRSLAFLCSCVAKETQAMDCCCICSGEARAPP